MDMTAILRLLLAALVASLGLVLVPVPAHACSCVGGDAVRFVDWADEVFVGTVVDVAVPSGAIISSTDPATYTFVVDTVFEGESTSVTQVASAVSGASCGLENMEVGRRYVVFASPPSRHEEARDAEHLWANLCGGTAPARPAYVAEVEAVTGRGRPPVIVQPTESPDSALSALFVGVLGLVITFLGGA